MIDQTELREATRRFERAIRALGDAFARFAVNTRKAEAALRRFKEKVDAQIREALLAEERKRRADSEWRAIGIAIGVFAVAMLLALA